MRDLLGLGGPRTWAEAREIKEHNKRHSKQVAAGRGEIKVHPDGTIASVLSGSIFSGLEDHADPRRSLLAVDAPMVESEPLFNGGFCPGPYRQLIE